RRARDAAGRKIFSGTLRGEFRPARATAVRRRSQVHDRLRARIAGRGDRGFDRSDRSGRRTVQRRVLCIVFPRAAPRRHPGAAERIADCASGFDQIHARRNVESGIRRRAHAALPAAVLSHRLVELHHGAQRRGLGRIPRTRCRGEEISDALLQRRHPPRHTRGAGIHARPRLVPVHPRTLSFAPFTERSLMRRDIPTIALAALLCAFGAHAAQSKHKTKAAPAPASTAAQPAAPSPAEKARIDALVQYQRDLVTVNALRSDAVHLLGAALLARPLPDQKPDFTFHRLAERAAAAPAAGPGVTWARLADCDPAANNCPNPEMLKKLQTQAGDNAAVWMLVMDEA